MCFVSSRVISKVISLCQSKYKNGPGGLKYKNLKECPVVHSVYVIMYRRKKSGEYSIKVLLKMLLRLHPLRFRWKIYDAQEDTYEFIC